MDTSGAESVDADAWLVPAGTKPDALVVEDDVAVASIVRTALEQAGYSVMVAPNIAGGRRALREFSPRVVVCDLSLPDGNGLDLVREMKALPQPPQRVVVLSGGSREVAAVPALEAGADDFLAKPFSPRELVARLSRR